jgi:hypothetical protein
VSIRTIPVFAGDRFGQLTVVEEAPRQRRTDGTSLRAFVVRCDCGTVKTVRLNSLREGKTVSCGCFHRMRAREVLATSSVTHGQSKTKLYGIWTAMKRRCHSTDNKSYWRYGARGIAVCQEWRASFEAFAAAVGPKPDGLTLDRIDSTGNYEPGNVRWADYTQQARNTRRNVWVQIGGDRMTLPEAVERNGWNYGTAYTAIRVHGKYKEATRVQP